MPRRLLGLVLAATLTTGCTNFVGAPSVTLLTQSEISGSHYEPVSERVDESECFYWFLLLFFAGHGGSSHEGLVDRTLAQYDADVLLDAQLSTNVYGIPYVFMRSCLRVEGTPARLRDAHSASRPNDTKRGGA